MSTKKIKIKYNNIKIKFGRYVVAKFAFVSLFLSLSK